MKMITIIIVSFFISFNSNAQRNPSNEILILIKNGITKEKTIINGVQKKELNFSSSLKSSLESKGIQTSMIEEAMPHFNEKDTVKVLPNGKVIRQLNMAKLFRIMIPEGASRNELVEWLKGLPEILYAEPNGTIRYNNTPNDTEFNKQWGFNNTANPGADVHAIGAWNIFTGDPNSIIAIIDTGVDFTHEDLDNKAAGGDIDFSRYHGTAVAGIAAAESNNGQGIAGMDWNAQIHSQRTDLATDFVEVHDAIKDAVDYSSNVNVLNMSFSLESNGEKVYSFVVHSALSNAYKANRTAVGVMGNHQQTEPGVVAYPGGLPTVIAVGATTIDDIVRDNSARGDHIDVVAPGENIFTTLPNDGYNEEYVSGNDTASVSGTSFAAPFVTGLASLLKGYRSNLANDDIKRIIELSADDLNDPNDPEVNVGFDVGSGHGRINAEAALNLLREPYVLEQSSATGGTVHSVTGMYSQQFFGASGIVDGEYNVKRYEVRTDVIFPMPFCDLEDGWGRGVASTGWSGANPNLTEGFTEIVPITLTNTGATLRTYVYEVWSMTGAYQGFHPTTAANVTYGYSVLGIPDSASQASIVGPSIVCTSSATFTLQDQPSSSTSITWSKSSNLSYVSGQDSSHYEVKASSSTIRGNGWVKATIPGACGNVVLTKNLWVGPPDQASNYTVWVDGNYGVNPITLAADAIYTFIIGELENYGVDGASSYFWDLPSGFSFVSSFCPSQDCDYVKLRTPQDPGTYTIKVYPSNVCGSSGTGYQSLQVDIPGGGLSDPDCPEPPCKVADPAFTDPGTEMSVMISYPNPTSDELMIHSNFNETSYELVVSDISGAVIYSYKGEKKLHQLNLSNFKSGLYFINATWKNQNGEIQEFQDKIFKN